jgi:hypothetical protein
MWTSLIGAGISAAGSAYGASQSAGAAGDAAKAQQEAAGYAATRNDQAMHQARNDLAPYMSSGKSANNLLNYGLGLDPYGYAKNAVLSSIRSRFPDIPENWEPDNATIQQYMNSPEFAGTDFGGLTRDFNKNDLSNDVVYNSGLQFGLDQGTGALNQRALAMGNYDSGATLKALTQFANDYGSTKANDAYNRFRQGQSQEYGMLSGQQNTGLGATNAANSIGMQSANTMGDYATQAGNARAAGIVGGANAWNNGMTGVGNAYNSYNNSQLLSSLLKPQTSNPYYTGGNNTLYNYSSGIDSSGMY